MQNKRTFIAIDFSSNVKSKLLNEVDELKRDLYKLPIKWVTDKNLHLTLKFIGEIGVDRIQKIDIDLKNSLNKTDAFKISFTNYGVFSSYKNPRIIWKGIEKNHQLQNSVNLINNICLDHGIEIEKRKFSPHITFGRIKNKLDEDQKNKLKEGLNNKKKTRVDYKVKNITFYESKLFSYGPEYNKISIYDLKD